VTADPLLGLAWLVLAHLVADFVLQTGWMARTKSARGGAALQGLLVHGVVVAVLLIPVGLAFGARGWWLLVVVSVSHVIVDRVKVVLTGRAEAAALADARRRHEATGADDAGLGPAWTPLPAALFALDQLVHVLIVVASWAALLSAAPLEPGFRDAAAGWFGAWDPEIVHETIVRAVVLTSLLIVNVRAGALFVAVLVGPRLAGAHGPAGPGATGSTAVDPGGMRPGRGWTLRFGPLVGRVDADPELAGTAVPEHVAQTPARPARVGEAIGILERLLVVTFLLARAEAAIGLVIAAKTLARFRQLDDRDFAEYYLLGTLASVAVAAISAFVATAVLGTLG
jgi:hypothetical protein